MVSIWAILIYFTLKNNLLFFTIFHLFSPAPDSPPFNCTALPTNSSTSISLVWSVPLQPNGLITYYSITYLPLSSTSDRDYGAEFNSTISTPTNSTSYIVGDLYKASLYSFSLQAFTVIGGSPIATDICTTSTIEDSKRMNIISYMYLQFFSNSSGRCTT